MTDRSVYTVPEVIKLLSNSLDYSRLDYWARTKVLAPSVMESKGKGSRRLYDFNDVIILRVLLKLRSEGVGQDRLRNVSKFLRKHDLRNLELEAVLITDGRNLLRLDKSFTAALSAYDTSDCDAMYWMIPVGLMVEAIKTQVTTLLEEDKAQDVG